MPTTSKIVGRKDTSFVPKDSETPITGTTFHLTEPFPAKGGGVGVSTDRIFLSSAKMAELDFVPAVGNVVVCHYNRWGKVETLQLVDETLDLGN